MMSGIVLPGLEQDYEVWRRGFWTAVDNGLKRDQTLTKNDKDCECSSDDKSSCTTDRNPHSSTEVLSASIVGRNHI